jgi:hypothetical protein
MKGRLKMKSAIVALALLTAACSPMNKDEVQKAAPAKWKAQGFEVVDYEGFEWGFWGPFGYGGARVWHRLRKSPDNGITYSGYIQKWGDEYHVYGPIAQDAIRPR